MLRKFLPFAFLVFLGVFLTVCAFSAVPSSPIQIFGVWHCGSDLCGWDHIRELSEFDSRNHWLIDRGDGVPAVNLVVLSFVNPLKLLNRTTDQYTMNGIPAGMTADIVKYFENKNVRVMLSIGGFTYTKDWDTALAADPSQLGANAAQVAKQLNVGTEIDYENDHNPNIAGLQKFIDAYRLILPYDKTGQNPAARLTIDLGSDDGYLRALSQVATRDWLTTSHPLLDYANAMVAYDEADSATMEAGWEEHVSGNDTVPPLAPAKLTGSLFITSRRQVTPECLDFESSLQNKTENFVRNISPHGSGTSAGLLGYMFWAAECPGSRAACTVPPNICSAVSIGAKAFNISIPMPALRQD